MVSERLRRKDGDRLETPETIILMIGVGLLGLGLALITGGAVGVLVARRQYGALVPLGLMLAAVALLLWESLVRIVVSSSLLLIGYTWLFAWWRASQQKSDWLLSHQSRSSQGNAAPPGGGTWRGTPGVNVTWATQSARSQEMAAMCDETEG